MPSGIREMKSPPSTRPTVVPVDDVGTTLLDGRDLADHDKIRNVVDPAVLLAILDVRQRLIERSIAERRPASSGAPLAQALQNELSRRACLDRADPSLVFARLAVGAARRQRR